MENDGEYDYDDMLASKGGRRWCQRAVAPLTLERIHEITSLVFSETEGRRFTKLELEEVLGYWMQRCDHQNHSFQCVSGAVTLWLAERLIGEKSRTPPTHDDLNELLQMVQWMTKRWMTDEVYKHRTREKDAPG